MFQSYSLRKLKPISILKRFINLQIFHLDYKKIISTIFLIICFAFENAYPLDWNSKEWLENSCQKNILGTWIPQSHSIFAFTSLKIDRQSISFIKNSLPYISNKFILCPCASYKILKSIANLTVPMDEAHEGKAARDHRLSVLR